MPKKVDNYDEQRMKILMDIFNIIGITQDNNTFSLHKMDNDIDKQNKIFELESDIKRYFFCGEWTCFKNKDKVKRRWLSMIKYLTKNLGYDMKSMQLKSNSEGFKYVDTYYVINPIKKV
jgi:hypothetical protein